MIKHYSIPIAVRRAIIGSVVMLIFTTANHVLKWNLPPEAIVLIGGAAAGLGSDADSALKNKKDKESGAACEDSADTKDTDSQEKQ